MFEDFIVIDCSTVLAGPSVGTFFAELGASVTKIENPAVPDVTRSWKLGSENKNTAVSAYFSSVNYHKHYLQLDFKNEKDLKELIELIEKADIFLSNFKKGDAEKFGLTDAYLLSVNPRLIIGKISGFGSESDRVAYDLILQAETGFMSMNGTSESGPVKMPVALIDVLAAHQLKEGILTALLKRTKTNQGQIVSVSLYDAAISSLANQASNYLMAGHIPGRIGSLHPNIAPYGEIFATNDGKLITFAIGSNKHFQILCDFLGLSHLTSDERFWENVERVKNRSTLQEIIQEIISRLDAKEIMKYMHEHFVPAGIIRNLEEVFNDPASKPLIRTEKIENIETKRVSQIAFSIKTMIEVKIPKSPEEWNSYYDLRYRILREPLGKERGSERNEGDETGIHFALYENGQLIAVARLDRVDQTICQARFVAVESHLQGLGYGRRIMTVLENEAHDMGYRKLILHARDYALPFYEKLGYTLVGPSYKLFDVLQHFEMFKVLAHGE